MYCTDLYLCKRRQVLFHKWKETWLTAMTIWKVIKIYSNERNGTQTGWTEDFR